MLDKSRLRGDHLAYLREVFELMRRHRLRLNLEKCAFRVEFGNFLGLLVSQKGIEMAPRQVKAIIKIPLSVTKKQIQTVIGKLLALNKVISRYLDQLRPFFAVLKGAPSKEWGLECDKDFRDRKKYVASLLSLYQPINGEDLDLYLVSSATAVSMTLVRSGEDGKKKPLYIVSKVLTDAETRYTDFE